MVLLHRVCIFNTESLTEPRAYQLVGLAGQKELRDLFFLSLWFWAYKYMSQAQILLLLFVSGPGVPRTMV